MLPMYFALMTLCNPDATSMAVRLALYHFIIGIAEAMRFPTWLRRFVGMLETSESDPAAIVVFSKYFKNWSSMCKRIRRGLARFEPGGGFEAYRDLFLMVSLLLSRPPDDELDLDDAAIVMSMRIHRMHARIAYAGFEQPEAC
ncbi:hypothetical protein U9M48_025414 [Paspalum notatum var. saurae]|uniref:Uncharacterized protein n=1 Tax=Paspalum notatum var. saurae TaxID=547442 RepID=A0AAQ3WXI2_PASNO